MISERSKAIILLTGYLPGSEKRIKPLSTTEYNKLGLWLRDNDLKPEDLIRDEGVVSRLDGAVLTKEKLSSLLSRSTALAICLEKWTRAGVWVINRSDPDYPEAYRKKLRGQSPPFFYGVGNRKVLASKAIGVVGSRKASEEDLKYAEELGKHITNQGFSVVSGGAKGIDEAAMLGALENDGTCIGILADKLLQRSTSKTYRQHLVRKNLVLLSPFHPEAGFNVGNAMGRNKYIYAKSNATCVIHSGSKGGTWNGAIENINSKFTPLYVKKNEDTTAGNIFLIKKGGVEMKEDVSMITFSDSQEIPVRYEPQPDLFTDRVSEPLKQQAHKVEETVAVAVASNNSSEILLTALTELIRQDFSDEFSIDEMKKQYGILANQAKKWIKMMLDLQLIIKKSDDKYAASK
jgi:predicted Rossmann fold nucleotide-binding protein DprA/Smf involved in DNA uptake